MQQLHKRLSIETTRLILDWYEQKLIDQNEALAKLGIKRRRFFTLLKQYRQGTLTTLVPPRTNAHRRLAKPLETVIRRSSQPNSASLLTLSYRSAATTTKLSEIP